MADAFPILVSTQWLAGNLEAADIAVLDASRHLPAANRDPRAEYEAGHIPGARFLDLETLTDGGSPVPSALPTAAQVAERIAQLGITPEHRIVLYDDSAVKTSARAWLALTSHGLANVAVLDGGLAKWNAEGHPLESGVNEFPAAAPAVLRDDNNVATKGEMFANLETGAEQVLDARAADRVFGSGIDPVHGGQNGRIPGSLNLPFGAVYADDGTFKSPAALRAEFENAGVDMQRPLVTTCGSGVTASVLVFAARLAGKQDVRLYDGSWQEWEADPATPKAQGPADVTGS